MNNRHAQLRTVLLSTIAIVVFAPIAGFADDFTYRDREGQTVTVAARLVASGQGQHVLELSDGEYRIVPQAAVSQRTPSDPPEPLTPDEVVEKLSQRFGGPERFRGKAYGHFVVGLVLDTGLSKTAEGRAQECLRKATKFQRAVEKNFLSFTRRMRIKTTPPTHPLVLIIFETDKAFEAYHREVTGGTGLSAGNVAGFYSPLSNWLVIRMTECLTFDTPLHEAIHQQVFNQHVLQRLAPTPAWFNEGIATGFEGNGDQISRGPSKVSVRYSRLANSARTVNWPILVKDDRAFRGDVFAGEAYTHAWCMHWLLVTRYKKEYTRYVERIGQDEPLAEHDPNQRRQDMEEIFGKSVKELQAEFPRALMSAVKRQKLPAPKTRRVGELNLQSNLADVSLVGVAGSRGQFGTEGAIRNISLIRPMTFHVVALTDSGMYAEWVIPNLGINKQVSLKRQTASKRVRGARGGPSRSFRLQVNSAAPDSRDAKLWEAGNTPTPTKR
jgi:hypothetical protein